MRKIFYFTIFVLVFSKCKKDTSLPESEHFYYYLTKEQLNKTPYFTNPKFDTLTFISNKNDTLVFAKAGTDTSWYETSDLTPSGYGDKIYHYQQLRNRYTTLKGEGKFEVLHGKKIFAVDVELPDGVRITFKNFNYFFRDYNIGLINKDAIDTFSIKNKKFYTVYLINNNKYDAAASQAYLNVDFGVFYILDFIKSDEWLINK